MELNTFPLCLLFPHLKAPGKKKKKEKEKELYIEMGKREIFLRSVENEFGILRRGGDGIILIRFFSFC